jgi:hypothetical protein
MDGQAHCLDYKNSLKHEDFETVKLYDEENARSKKCLVFSDEHGLEGLLFVEARFRKVAEQFGFDGPQLFTAFEEVLQGTALSNWEQLANDVDEEDRTEEVFNERMVQYYMDYCDKNARDTMYDYLKKCRKPVGEEPRVHVRRLELLYSYSAKLPGIEELLTPDQIKRAIFRTFPESWQKQYVLAGKDLQVDSMQDVVTFMQNIKAYADDDKGKKRTPEEHARFGNKNKKAHVEHQKGNVRNNNQGKVQPHDQCPFHFGHKWIDCFENSRGPNFRPRNQPSGSNRGGRNQNNGPFRPNPGRGLNGGRGMAYNGRGGRGNNGQDRYTQNGNGHNTPNNYHFENGRDQDRDRGRRVDALPQRGNPRERNHANEQHYFDQIGEQMLLDDNE